MKKIYLAAIAALIGFPFALKAQTWSGSTPGDIYYNSGKVGIGTSTPNSLLHLYNATPALQLSPSSYGSTNYASYFGSLSTAVGVLQLGNNGQNDIVAGNTATGGFLRFIVNNSNTFPSAANGTVAMTINPSGDVGIGTSPAYKLDIAGATNIGGSTAPSLFFSPTSGSGGYNGQLYQNGSKFLIASSGLFNAMTVDLSNGSVGIGTTSPVMKLHVEGGIFANNNGNNGLILNSAGANYGFISNNSANTWSLGYGSSITTLGMPVLTWNGSGKVGIGTTMPDEKLSVLGTVHANEVKVDLSVPGPDYVFKPDYKLASLAEVKTYVYKNHHLPEIPTADEMAKNGLSLGDMNTKLLKKVEELTLYLIEKDKQVAIQQKTLASQAASQRKSERRLARLEAQLTNRKKH